MHTEQSSKADGNGTLAS